MRAGRPGVRMYCVLLPDDGVQAAAVVLITVLEGMQSRTLGMRAPLVAALLICLIAAVVSAFASTTGIIGALIPLAVPFLQQGEIGPVGMIAALAISSTVVDVSPFSTNGALVVANAPPEERDSVYKRFLAYSILVIIAGPALAWLMLVVPDWF